MTAGSFIGIDVAKRELQVAGRPGGDRGSASNDVAGIAGLIERIRAAGPIALIVVEATGGYEIALVAALTAAALPVVVVIRGKCGTSRGPSASWPRPKCG